MMSYENPPPKKNVQNSFKVEYEVEEPTTLSMPDIANNAQSFKQILDDHGLVYGQKINF